MTVSDVATGMAMPSSSRRRGPNASASTPARARTSVATSITERVRKRRGRVSPLVGHARRVGRVVYLDAADSWWLNGRSLSAKQVFAAEYVVPGNYQPFAWWCRFYRYPATAFAFWQDAWKWLFIHPVRGPLTFLGLLVAAAVVGLAVVG